MSASVESRVGVDLFDPSESAQQRKFAFKAHRQMRDGAEHVYPINQVLFHPSNRKLATAGGDGLVSIWDLDQRKCVKHWRRYPAPITAMAFNANGTEAAIATGHMASTEK